MIDVSIPVLVILAAATFALCAVLIPALARVAPRMRLLDHPSGEKRHEGAVPLVGGFSIAVASLLVLGIASFWLPRNATLTWWFYLSVLLMLIGGVADDVFKLSYSKKALLQLIAVLPVVLYGGLKILFLGALFGQGEMHLGWFTIPFTLICLIAYINALNMIDGLDGLAGGVAFIALILFSAAAWLCGAPGLFLIGLTFAAATAAFLAYNLRTPWRSKAAVFLGDAGATVLALVIGWCAIQLVKEHGHLSVSPMGVAWVFALPVMDTLVVMGRRMRQKRSPFMSDRQHLHHLLVDMGLSSGRTTAVLILVSFLYGLFGLAGSFAGLPDWVLFASFLCVFVLHVAFVSFARYRVASAPVRPAYPDPAS